MCGFTLKGQCISQKFSILDLISQSPEKIQDLDLLTRKNSVIFKHNNKHQNI